MLDLAQRSGQFVGLTAAALVLAGCTDGGSRRTDGAPRAEPTGTTITVTETEYSLELPQQELSPGTHTFVVRNEGKVIHALAIGGPGVERESDAIRGGEETRLTATLKPGSYELWCPVGEHRDLGMTMVLRVARPGP